MSLNAGRRCSKIVIPPAPNQEEKLLGGLKNALDRGETLAKAKQSFINAGYKPAEVTAVAQKIPTATPVIGKQIAAVPGTPIKSETTPNPLSTNQPANQPKKFSKKLIIILISISAIILIGAVVLGLFWNTIF